MPTEPTPPQRSPDEDARRPRRPSHAETDARIAEGRRWRDDDHPSAACEAWLEAWPAVLGLARSRGLRSIEAVDEEFEGKEVLFNWVQELEEALWNAGQHDRTFWKRSLAYFEQYLDQFTDDDALLLENMRRALGTTHAALGRHHWADALFGEWLDRDPEWGWGWIGWSDCYHLVGDFLDHDRAENLLQRGLAVLGVRDEPDLLERLCMLYEAAGREAEAEQARAKGKKAERRVAVRTELSSSGSVLRVKQTVDFEGNGLPLDELVSLKDMLRRGPVGEPDDRARPKFRRNAPCPCGSGKKYKKCCGSGGSP